MKVLMYKDLKFDGCSRWLMIMLMACYSQAGSAQNVSVTATLGTASGSFTTLKGAFDAINAGTHRGVIAIKIDASTAEVWSAVLNARGSGSASYTGITIYPTTTGLSITGSLEAPLINLNGADNVTIDGRVNATGSTKSLTISNTSTSSTAGTSTIRFINDASTNTVQYCILQGSSSSASFAGTVLFSTTTGTTGNDNNTITHNDITNAGGNRPLTSVLATSATAGKQNNNNTISNNNFYDFLNASNSGHGVFINHYNTAYTISGNSFYETTVFNTLVAGLNHKIIVIEANLEGENGFTVSGNYIGGSAASCGGSAWTKTGSGSFFAAIYVITTTGNANEIQGNIIQNISWSNSSAGDFMGIYLGSSTVANIGTVTGNTIGASTGIGSIQFVGGANGVHFSAIYLTTSGAVTCNNNTIGSITAGNSNPTNGTHIYGIQKATSGNLTISNNTIGSTITANSIQASSASTTSNQYVYGIYQNGSGTVNISANTISNLVNATTNSAISTAYGVCQGIYVVSGSNTITDNTVSYLSNANAAKPSGVSHFPSVGGIIFSYTTAAAQTISGNTVHNLSNSFSTFSGDVIGIYYKGSTTAGTVSRNFIHSLSVTGASSTTADLYGIRIDAGAATYSNNIVSLGGNTLTDLFGIYQTGAASNNNNLYFNTVNISGSPASGTNPSYALFSTGTSNTRDFRNNVLVNARSTTGGSNLHYAMYIDATGGTLTCDYNNYFVSGTGGVLGRYGSLSANNKTALPIVTGATGNDASSTDYNPLFSATGTTATDYTAAAPHLAETGTGITVDYSGTTRDASVPAMGALANSCVSAANPSAAGTIDASQSGARPFNPAAFTSTAAATGVTGTLEYMWQSSTTSSSAGFSTINGAQSSTYDAAALNNTTWFKRLARASCQSWTTAPESNVLQVGVIWPVELTATSATATGTFNTLKDAFDAINAGTHKGDIVIKINASTTESSSAALNASGSGSASYTGITIYPTTTGLSITGNLVAPLIDLNGADNVTIDGRVDATGSTKSLTISNTSTAATTGTSTIRFISDATANVVKYCTLKGSENATLAGIVFFSTGTSTGNDNNTIDNNDITNAADGSRPVNAVFASGTSAMNNNGNTISNNNIYNFLSRSTSSQGINIGSYNTTFTISGNSFYETAAFNTGASVIYNVILISAATGSGNGFIVSGNYIGGSEPLCAGTAWTKTGQDNRFTAIQVTTATGTANSIQGNTVQNINWTNSGTALFTGIHVAGATVSDIGTVTGNTIGAASGLGSIQVTSANTGALFYGINIASSDVVVCSNNIIGSITAACSNAAEGNSFIGIVKSASIGTTTISNNTIGSTTTASSIQASSICSTAAKVQTVYGIQSAGSGTVTISGNTVANLVNATTNATTTTAGLISGINVSAGTNTISNNTVRNLSIANANTSITGTASATGIVMTSKTPAPQTVSGNTVFNLSNSNTSFEGGVIGLYYSGPTTASTVSRNFIHSLSVTGSSSTTADIYGIKIDAGATTYSNNIVSLGGNTTTDLFGIYQTGAFENNNNLYFNTVNISGSPASGTNPSYALFSTGTSNSRDYRNNVLVNARSTTSGSNLHYAMYIAASGGTLNCNYNNYFVSGTGTVLGYFGANKTTAAIVSGQTGNDANSIATNPTFVGSGTTASDYTATVPGGAVGGTGITVDFAGNTRNTPITMGALSYACVSPTSGGSIAAAQSGSSPFDPAAFTSSAAASGHTGTLEYKWQSSTTSNTTGFSDIASSNSDVYDPGSLTQTTWYKRLARVSCQSDWTGAAESNVLEVTICVNPTSGGTIAAAQSGSSPFDPAAFTSSVAASGHSGTLEYKWQSSTTSSSTGFSDIASSNSATYDAGSLTQTTWYKRLARVSCKSDWAGAAESNVLEVTVSSMAVEPTAQPTVLYFTTTGISSTFNLVGRFTASASATGYLVVRNTGSAPTFTPVDGTAYSAGSQTGGTVVYSGSATDFTESSVTLDLAYHYAVYAFNGSGSNTNYLTTSPLSGMGQAKSSSTSGSSVGGSGTLASGSTATSLGFPGAGATVNFPAGTSGTTLNVTKNNSAPSSNIQVSSSIRGMKPIYFSITSSTASPGAYTLILDFSALSLTATQWNSYKVTKRANASSPWVDVTTLGATIVNRQTDGVLGKFTITGLSSFSEFGLAEVYDGVVVSNLDVINSATDAPVPVDGDSYAAQAFTTDGIRYQLSKVKVSVSSGAASTLRAKLYSSHPDGKVNAQITTLGTPTLVSGSVYELTPSDATVKLEPNTQYWMVFYTTTSGTTVSLNVAESVLESGPANFPTNLSSGSLNAGGSFIDPDTFLPVKFSVEATEVSRTWTGTSTTDWSTAGNWTPSETPGSGEILTIPNVANDPVLPANTSVAYLTIASGAVVNLADKTLTVTHGLSQDGTMTGTTGKLVMAGTAAQGIEGTGTIRHLEINNSAGVAIFAGSHMQTITGKLTPTSGTLSTNGNLTLRSDINGTARVGQGSASGGYIIGDVVTQRYLSLNNTGRNGRAWRLVTIPVTGTGKLSDVFMAGQSGADLTNSTNRDAQPSNLGTVVIGHNQLSATAANDAGYDWIGVAGQVSSLRFYQPNTGGGSFASSQVPDLNTTYTDARQGYMLFARGDRRQDYSSASNASATVLQATGALKQGTIPVSIVPLATAGFVLVGNPYMAVLDLEKVILDNAGVIDQTMYVWDASINGNAFKQGGYRTLVRTSPGAWTVTGIGSNPQYIESGSAFFVKPTSAGGTLSIKESHKVDGTPGIAPHGSMTDGPSRLFINLEVTDTANRRLVDGAVTFFDTNYKDGLGDAVDIAPMTNLTAGSITLRQSGVRLSMEGRPWPADSAARTIPVDMRNLGDDAYVLRILPTNMSKEGFTAWLKDRHLNKETSLKTDDETLYPFRRTGDLGIDSSRFEIVYRLSKPANAGTLTPDDAAGEIAPRLYPNPAKSADVKLSLGSLAPGRYEVQVLDISGRSVMTRSIEHLSSTGAYQILKGQKLATGQYLIRLSLEGKVLETLQFINE